MPVSSSSLSRIGGKASSHLLIRRKRNALYSDSLMLFNLNNISFPGFVNNYPYIISHKGETESALYINKPLASYNGI